MFKTLHSKLIAFIALVLLSTASAVVYLTHRDVGREVMHIEQNNVENILDGVFLNLQGVYRNVIADRIDSIEHSRERLQRESDFVLAVLTLYAQNTTYPTPSAVSEFRNWLAQLDMGTTNFFIADTQGQIFFDSENNLVQQNLSELSDIRGQPLSGVVNTPQSSFAQFAVFSPNDNPDIQKLAFLQRTPAWDWILGAFVDISHIKAREKARLAQVVKELESQFAQARITDTGSLFIFNREHEIIIPPAHIGFPERLLPNLPTRTPQMQRDRPERSVILVDGERLVSYTRYFQSLNWFLGAIIPETELQAPAQELVRRQSVLIGGIFVLSVIAAMGFAQLILRPLGLLATEAKQLAQQDLTTNTYTPKCIETLTRKYTDEVGALAAAFLFMQAELKNNVRRLLETTAAKERYQSELNVAREIQMSFLPQELPLADTHRELALYALLEPAREVGGDLYDFFMLDDTRLCFTIGDVSDKGMPAALYMAITRTLIQSYTARESDPGHIIRLVNDSLSKDNPKSMFVTLILGIIDIHTGQIGYANAGHNPPIIMTQHGECDFVQGISGPVVGAIEGMDYHNLNMTLTPGDSLFLYTDGVTEAMNPQFELFSDERLLQTIRHAHGASPESLIQHIRSRLSEFAADAPQSDDITMLMIAYHGQTTTAETP